MLLILDQTTTGGEMVSTGRIQRAHRDFAGASDEQRRNRALLEEVMARHGFVGLPTEWWHFDAAGWQSYPISDEPL